MYPETRARLFYFCRLCFDQGSRTCLANDSFNDWAHLSTAQKYHESSNSHMKFYRKWIEVESRLKGRNTTDKSEQLLAQKESERRKNVLTRLMNITLYLVEKKCGIWAVSSISCVNKKWKIFTPHSTAAKIRSYNARSH
jgi:hypothetical protein